MSLPNHKKLTPGLALIFTKLSVKQHSKVSLIGLNILFTFVLQILSGVMISFSLNCDPMNIPQSRNEEDSEDLYTDDFFWVHERGVDFSFIFIYAHAFRKFQIGSFNRQQEGAWKTGTALLLFLHAVTFFGLVLCCTHLSEVTLTIAANMMHSVFMKYGKTYWWLFPNQELNTDTILRLMYAHYTGAFVLFGMSIYHSLEMHYDWKDSEFDEAHKVDLNWFDDAIMHELATFIYNAAAIASLTALLYDLSEPASTELFMWGDVGAVSEIRFYGVTPHWYFRAYMAWLIVCPHHYMGLGGLGFFLVTIYYQPNIKELEISSRDMLICSKSPTIVSLNVAFLMSVLFGASYLPYGKFFNRLGGNPASLASFSFILVFLASPMYIWVNSINRFFTQSVLTDWSGSPGVTN